MKIPCSLPLLWKLISFVVDFFWICIFLIQFTKYDRLFFRKLFFWPVPICHILALAIYISKPLHSSFDFPQYLFMCTKNQCARVHFYRAQVTECHILAYSIVMYLFFRIHRRAQCSHNLWVGNHVNTPTIKIQLKICNWYDAEKKKMLSSTKNTIAIFEPWLFNDEIHRTVEVSLWKSIVWLLWFLPTSQFSMNAFKPLSHWSSSPSRRHTLKCPSTQSILSKYKILQLKMHRNNNAKWRSKFKCTQWMRQADCMRSKSCVLTLIRFDCMQQFEIIAAFAYLNELAIDCGL